MVLNQKFKINLGTKVKDIYTGFAGRVTGATVFVNGCIQYIVSAEYKEGSTEIAEFNIDEAQLEVIGKPIQKKIKKKTKKKPNGGATSKKLSYYK